MANYKNLELLDGVRKDARILMEKNPNLKYEDAFNIAKRALVGEEDILKMEVKPIEVEYDEKLVKEDIVKETNEPAKEIDIFEPLKSIIDVNKFSKEQLFQYLTAYDNGLDITLFADNRFTPLQLKFFITAMISGKDVDQYFNDYEFDPNEAFNNILEGKSKKYYKEKKDN